MLAGLLPLWQSMCLHPLPCRPVVAEGLPCLRCQPALLQGLLGASLACEHCRCWCRLALRLPQLTCWVLPALLRAQTMPGLAGCAAAFLHPGC